MTSTATYRPLNSAGHRCARTHRGHEISYTDKVYARLTLAGRVVAEFTRDRISDFSSLLLLLRAMTPSRKGLARLTVRNMTRGWRLERPMMLYPEPGCGTDSVCPMPYEFH
ncbi:MAG: hypothetical protein NC402_03645 [Prevotella sp.]|nr:hypothetical protein [Prevotella sp.]MCM1074911.1 hypothetical protein [Ruminococcus sp.]